MSNLHGNELLLYYFKFVYSWKWTGKWLWVVSHITMGVDLEAQRRHVQHPHSSIPRGTVCVPKQKRVRVYQTKQNKQQTEKHLWTGHGKSKQCLKVL